MPGIRSAGKLKTFLVLCAALCLLPTMFARVEFSANPGSAAVVVEPPGSIQSAIDNANASSTIFVAAGTYQESLQINKSITLIGAGRDQTFIDGQRSDFIVNIAADNVDIEDFTFQSLVSPVTGINIVGAKADTISYCTIEDAQQGILLTSSSGDTISNNIITQNGQGIGLQFSRINVFSENMITANAQGGISLFDSYNNQFLMNMVVNNTGGGGISINFYGNNVFSGNTFSDNTIAFNHPYGEDVSSSSNNVFFDNNFNDSVYVSSPNTWDNGFEGNYWSNYDGHDNGTGIGIENYTLGAGNVDRHPLMGQFSSFDATLANQTYQVSIISNSTIFNPTFEIGTETGNKIIAFNVTGPEGTTGFSRVTIPIGLMNNTVIVLVGDEEVNAKWLKSQTTTTKLLYLNYSQNNQTAQIISSETLDLYYQLLDQFLASNETFYQLLNNYTAQLQTSLQNLNATFSQLLNNYSTQLQTNLQSLNSLYTELLNDYANLLGNYSQLQQNYTDLSSSYQNHISDYNQTLQNVHNITYIFAAAVAVLIIVIVYFSRNAYSRPPKTRKEHDEPQV